MSGLDKNCTDNYNNSMKRIFLLLFLPLILLGQRTNWNDGDIAIIQTVEDEESRNLTRNLIQGVSIEIERYRVNQDSTEIANAFSEIAGRNYKLVIVIGQNLTGFAQRSIRDIPVIIVGSLRNLKNVHKADTNITGVFGFVSIKNQYRLLKMIKPDLNRIGIIFNPDYTLEQVEIFQSVVEDTTIKFVKNGVSKPREVGTALHFLSDIDALWIPKDPTLENSEAIDMIRDFSEKNSVPVFSSDVDMVREIAIAALIPVNISLETLSMITTIMKGESISSISPRYPASSLFLNIKAANSLGLKIPDNLILSAKEVYK